MEIVIPTIGSRGDVQPFIALSQGLIGAGYAVRIASHPGMQHLVEDHDVPFVGIGPDIDMSVEAGKIRDRTGSPIVGLYRAMQYAFQVMEDAHEDLLEICPSADLLIVHAQSGFGKSEAELVGLPYAGVTFMPWVIPYDDPSRPIYKRVGYRIFDSIVSLMTNRPMNRMRRKQGLPPVGKEGFFSPTMNLIPVSPAVYSPNPLWGAGYHTTGYWFAEDPTPWSPEKVLEAFLQDGPPPLVVSLGAMASGEKSAAEVVPIFLDAIQGAGARAVIQGWQANLSRYRFPPSILPIGSVPHTWLLSRAAGIVHHGGFGTTAAGFRAGTPQLAVPHLADQFFWGKQIEDLEVGPPMIPRGRLTVTGLESGLRRLLEEDRFMEQARAIRKAVGSEAGVAEAVELIEQGFGSPD